MKDKECIHCGLCRKNCLFLEKYGIDIGDTEQLRNLAYHCFLCGKCTEVCPIGIDGRKIILDMRREQVAENGDKLKEKGYGMLLWEKQDYRFANYRKQTKHSVLFPGCNFPSFYPKTTRYLSELLHQTAGIGVILDCCGKPVAELGLQQKSESIINRLNERLKRAKIEEVVILCPNCYHFLKPRLNVSVVSIYAKLKELGLGKNVEEQCSVFPPCPDRKNQEMFREILPYLTEEPLLLQGVQCCGLGGCASGKEPELAKQMMPDEKERGENFVTYCASCAGNFARKGIEAEHILLKVLGVEEKPDTGNSVFNRMKTKFWRR